MRIIVFIICLLILTIPLSTHAEENQDQQAPPIFISPQRNIFIPNTPQQKQALDNLMQLYIEGKTRQAQQLERTILNEPNFKKGKRE